MASLYTLANRNVAKTWAMMVLFFLLVIALGWVARWYVGASWPLWVAVLIAVGGNIYSYWYSDRLVLALTGAREAPREMYPELHRIVENLAITAGIPKPRVFVVDDPSPNAFATGRDPNHAAIAVTRGLLELLDRSELEGVIAHEMAHIINRDILVSTVAVVLVGVVSLIADILLRLGMVGAGERRHPLFVVAMFVGALIAPFAAQLMHLAISRQREFLADASGALLTRYPEGLASALQKIHMAIQRRPLSRASHATAHLFFANPLGEEENEGRFLRWVNRLFSTHPPVEERVARLLSYASHT